MSLVIKRPTDRQDTNGFGAILLLVFLFWPLGFFATLIYVLAGRMAHSFLILLVTIAMALLTQAFWLDAAKKFVAHLS